MPNYFTCLRPLIHCLPPEAAHNLGLWALRRGVLASSGMPVEASLNVQLGELSFASPVGLAAGFDKNAVAIDALLRQGFGFVEAGTVTPKPQPGNPKPRIFRLIEDEAVINRLGFNNKGLDYYLRHFQSRHPVLGIAGANIGKNKDSDDAIADYITGLKAVYPYADYVTVNISSPNTQGLRALQEKQALGELLAALVQVRGECVKAHGRMVPLWLKVAPDLDEQGRQDIAQSIVEHGIDALVVSNTTLSRPETLRSHYRMQQGGLSGRPLCALAEGNLKAFYHLLNGKIPLVGVGGIASTEDAYRRIRAGASLVQLYTALVYQGFGLVRRINSELPQLLARDGFTHISEAVGADAR